MRANPYTEGGVRLQKVLAQAGVASRRASEQMIADGLHADRAAHRTDLHRFCGCFPVATAGLGPAVHGCRLPVGLPQYGLHNEVAARPYRSSFPTLSLELA